MKNYKVLTAFALILISLCNSNCNTSSANLKQAGNKEEYVCTPCGVDCDNISYNEAGKCPHCGMPLVKKNAIHFTNIQPSDLCKYIAEHPQTILLDVRTKEEFEGKANPDFGTLKNAINVPIQVLEDQISTLAAYKDKEIIVYCSHSHRSPRACYILNQNGFSKVINMASGMSTLTDNSCKK